MPEHLRRPQHRLGTRHVPNPAGRRQKFAVREELTEGQVRDVEDEIGTIPGRPGEDAFNKEWVRLMNDKYGGVDELASRYKRILLQFMN